jgi:hypothetical protein
MPVDEIRPVHGEEDEDDIVLEDDECDGDDDEMMENPLVDLLVSSDGDNVADAIANGLDKIAKHLDAQNKIFIKLYTVLSKISPSSSA